MTHQQKTEQLKARQVEAYQTATEAVKQAKDQFNRSYRTIKILGFTFELYSRKAEKKLATALQNRLAILRQYGAMLQAVDTDYVETNYIRTN